LYGDVVGVLVVWLWKNWPGMDDATTTSGNYVEASSN
jgi:hypothetical protein